MLSLPVNLRLNSFFILGALTVDETLTGRQAFPHVAHVLEAWKGESGFQAV